MCFRWPVLWRRVWTAWLKSYRICEDFCMDWSLGIIPLSSWCGLVRTEPGT